jgi:hypothetical protein
MENVQIVPVSFRIISSQVEKIKVQGVDKISYKYTLDASSIEDLKSHLMLLKNDLSSDEEDKEILALTNEGLEMCATNKAQAIIAHLVEASKTFKGQYKFEIDETILENSTIKRMSNGITNAFRIDSFIQSSFEKLGRSMNLYVIPVEGGYINEKKPDKIYTKGYIMADNLTPMSLEKGIEIIKKQGNRMLGEKLSITVAEPKTSVEDLIGAE